MAATIICLAIVKSSASGFHHCSWDVASINDIGLGAMRMHDKGWTKGWGLGRHVLGSNYFHYVRDPWGSFAEYSCDIDYIPKEDRWPAADHKPEDSVLSLGSRRAARVHHQLRGGRRRIVRGLVKSDPNTALHAPFNVCFWETADISEFRPLIARS